MTFGTRCVKRLSSAFNESKLGEVGEQVIQEFESFESMVTVTAWKKAFTSFRQQSGGVASYHVMQGISALK